MRRNSRLACEIANALDARGVHVVPRRLERWWADGLGPIASTTLFEHQLSHFAQVATLATSGRDNDVVALRLGARGLVCGRLREALLRKLEITPEPPAFAPVVIDLSDVRSPEQDGDVAFAHIEQRATIVENSGPRIFQQIRAALIANAAPLATRLGETPADIVHSIFTSWGCLLAGDDLYNPDAWYAALNVPAPPEDDSLTGVVSTIRPDYKDVDDAYRLVPVENIVAIAQWLVAHAPAVLDHLGVTTISHADLEEWCCVFAPYAAYEVALLAQHLSELDIAEEDLASVFRDYLSVRSAQPTPTILEAPFPATG